MSPDSTSSCVQVIQTSFITVVDKRIFVGFFPLVFVTSVVLVRSCAIFSVLMGSALWYLGEKLAIFMSCFTSQGTRIC